MPHFDVRFKKSLAMIETGYLETEDFREIIQALGNRLLEDGCPKTAQLLAEAWVELEGEGD